MDDKITMKKSSGFYPFNLVYGKEGRLPLKKLLPVYIFMTEEKLQEIDIMKNIINALVELD